AAVWTPVASGGNYSGYQYNPNGGFTGDVSKRWGTNLTSAFPGGGLTKVENNSQNNSFTTVLGSSFDSPGTSSQAIGVSGDSGGAWFSSDSPSTLLGIMLYQDQGTVPADQPSGTAIYGNYTEAGDLASYVSQIQQVTGIPEP